MSVMLWGAGSLRGQGHPTPLGPADVLILVNADSPCSRSVADLYRRFYPGIADEQVVYLYGLPDSAALSATPAQEIITRQQFETLIAQPVRDYLIATGLVNNVYCIITTAGMPYRIKDTNPLLANVVYPNGSNPTLTLDNRDVVNAASVESELAVLFQIDSAVPAGARMPINGRVVNPYQGYADGIKSWASIRDIIGRRTSFRWDTGTLWMIQKPPRIEGELRWENWQMCGFSAYNRRLSPADIYLVARLDGPRQAGTYPIFSVHQMLKRAAAAGNPSIGYNPALSTAVIDNAPNAPDVYAYSRILNFPPQYDVLSFSQHSIPPGAEEYSGQFSEGNHFMRTFYWLTGMSPPSDVIVTHDIDIGLGGVAVWDDTNTIMNQNYLASGAGIIGLLTYGRNGGDGRPAGYLLTSGPDGGNLFKCVPGAVFASLESFNAVTMFTDVNTLPSAQGKIVDFIQMGGTAAVGHSFEPVRCAAIQGEFLFRNLLRDDDMDGVGDLTLVEAAFSALPYLSWSEVLIGDPLMRLRHGPGALVNTVECREDVDGNGIIRFSDMVAVQWYLFAR
ncbi:MAG: hypothetical protein GXY44_04920, partial [Phycisphaerales bacterium]|nr:hypothetical protein [Phycisphaerales bacterium]